MEPTISIVGALVIGFVSAVTGALVGGGAALVVMGRALNNINRDTALLNAIEGLTTSIPADQLETFNTAANNLATLADILRKVTDRLPNNPSV